MIFNFNTVFCYDLVFFTYTSSKLEVLNNNDYCSKSVASSLRFSIQFFKTQLKIPRNRCATFFKRLGDTYKHTLHFGRFCHKLSKKYQVKQICFDGQLPSGVNQKSYMRWLDKKNGKWKLSSGLLSWAVRTAEKKPPNCHK